MDTLHDTGLSGAGLPDPQATFGDTAPDAPPASPPDLAAAAARLALLPSADYDRTRKVEAAALSVRAATLDAAVKAARAALAAAEAKDAPSGEPERVPPSPAEVALTVGDLARLDALAYQFARKAEAARLGMNVTALDAQVAALRKQAFATRLDGMERPDGVPRGFELRTSGVFELREGDAPDLFVCGPLEVAALVEDGAGTMHGRLLRWADPAGRPHEWAARVAMLAGDGAELRARLLDEGLELNLTPAAFAALSRYIMAAKPSARARVASRLGWHETPGGLAFVLPGATLGAAGAVPVVLQADRPGDLPPLAEAGTLDAWQREVAGRAVGNSRVAFALSCAFAAPLLTPMQAEGGGFNLRGASSTGKTATLDAAGSVWGGGGLHGWKRTWNSTANGLEGVARMHSDLLLTLDEMGQAPPEVVAAGAYLLANGQGKSRAAREGTALRHTGAWRVLFLSSGEVSLADRLAEARGGPRRAQAGQEVRVVDVPADAEAGLGVFETLYGAADGASFAKALTHATRQHHGTAGRAFLTQLAAELDAAVRAVRQAQADFLRTYLPPGASGQVARVADRFALAAAAGELAAAMGVLPWQEGEATAAAARCFADWRGARAGGNGAAEDAAALVAVRHFIGLHGAARFEALMQGQNGAWTQLDPARPVQNRAGWRKPEAGGGARYCILPDVWAREVCAGLDPSATARALLRAGFLDGQGGRPTRMERVGEPEAVRVYAVRGRILAGHDTAAGADGDADHVAGEKEDFDR